MDRNDIRNGILIEYEGATIVVYLDWFSQYPQEGNRRLKKHPHGCDVCTDKNRPNHLRCFKVFHWIFCVVCDCIMSGRQPKCSNCDKGWDDGVNLLTHKLVFLEGKSTGEERWDVYCRVSGKEYNPATWKVDYALHVHVTRLEYKLKAKLDKEKKEAEEKLDKEKKGLARLINRNRNSSAPANAILKKRNDPAFENPRSRAPQRLAQMKTKQEEREQKTKKAAQRKEDERKAAEAARNKAAGYEIDEEGNIHFLNDENRDPDPEMPPTLS